MDFGVRLGASGAPLFGLRATRFSAQFSEHKKQRLTHRSGGMRGASGGFGGCRIQNGSSTPHAPTRGAGGFKALRAFRRAGFRQQIVSKYELVSMLRWLR